MDLYVGNLPINLGCDGTQFISRLIMWPENLDEYRALQSFRLSLNT